MSASSEIRNIGLSVYCSGMRYQARPDLLLIKLSNHCSVGCVFTQSSIVAAPITWCLTNPLVSKNPPKAILINSGIANAMTGKQGLINCHKSANLVSKLLKIPVNSIYLASTGIIGPQLDITCLEKTLSSPKPFFESQTLNEQSLKIAASAIMTTDTFPKYINSSVTISGKSVLFCGIAKGSGMIAPNMATLLAFVFCDASIDSRLLQKICSDVTSRTFNALSVDGDTSTNDTFMLIACKKKDSLNITNSNTKEYLNFISALEDVCNNLVKQLAKDGEGATKIVYVSVKGGKNDKSASIVAKCVANSPLVKTAIFASDANWGRIAMAIGKSGENINENKLAIYINKLPIVERGIQSLLFDENKVSASMKNKDINIDIDLGAGVGRSHCWTCDFSEEYIRINSDYRS